MTDTMKPKALSTNWIDGGHTWLFIRVKDFHLFLHRYEAQKLVNRLTGAKGPLPPPTPEDSDRFDIVARSLIPLRGKSVRIGHVGFDLNGDELAEWVQELPRRLAEPAEPDDEDDDEEYDDFDDDDDDRRLSLPLVTCDGCGACCMRQGSPPGYGAFFNDDPPEIRRLSGKAVTGFAWEEIPTHLRDEMEAYHKAVNAGEMDSRYEEGLPCLWLDVETGRCRNYEWRPRACKGFPVGGKSCRAYRDEQGID
jgi:Fe-S-cluster containining protein